MPVVEYIVYMKNGTIKIVCTKTDVEKLKDFYIKVERKRIV